jgi:hypothetical protein
MDLDHGMSTAKCIWFLYKILHIIPLAQRIQLLDELLCSKKFYHYFFHWSYNVRMVFYYLYFFQFYQNLNSVNPAQILDVLGLPDDVFGGESGTVQKKKTAGILKKSAGVARLIDVTRTA